MKIHRATKRLLVLFVFLLGLDLAGLFRSEVAEELPQLPSFIAADVTQVSLSQGDARIEMERTGPRAFSLASPISQPADFGRVNAILSTLYAGVQMAVRVEQGNLEQYGLSGQSAVLVSVSGTEIAFSFVVGADSAGGTTFVRFPNDDVVYRARIGGRHKYDGSASAWRNHMVVDRPEEAVYQLHVQNEQGEAVHFSRTRQGADNTGKAEFGPWQWRQKTLSLDQVAVDDLLRSLTTMRAGDLLSADDAAGFDVPIATVRLALDATEEITLHFHVTEGGTFVQRTDQDIVYRVAGSITKPLLGSIRSWQDRTLMAFAPSELDAMVLRDTRLTTRIQRDPSTGELQITEPKGMDTDRRAALFTARKLAELRAESLVDISPLLAGFETGTTLTVALLDKRTLTVQIGSSVPQSTVPKLYVRAMSQPDRVGVLDAALVARMFKAWSR